MTRFLQYLFDGLSSGAIYALLALGLVIIFRGTSHLNFAQGELAMLSAFFAWWLNESGLPFWFTVLLSAVFGFAIATLVEHFIIRPIGRRSTFAVGVALIGLFLGINSLAPFAWKVTIPEQVPSLFPNAPDDFVRIGGATWRIVAIGNLVVTLAVAGLLFVLFQRTKLGLAMRAVASNPDNAPLTGIKVGRVLMVSWGLAAFVGAVGGGLVASQNGQVESTMMFTIFFSATAAAMLGGFDSLLGAVVAGLLLGVLENTVAGYQPELIGQELRGTVSLIVILVVLLVRPSGLFGSARVERV
ncbi:MAG: branched-chain amino acid ABC transporter permease [Acidimicrobiia bacterium]|nr:branched-chain amino acid ABC transporter permease [Acidimicrobiia bacterium]